MTNWNDGYIGSWFRAYNSDVLILLQFFFPAPDGHGKFYLLVIGLTSADRTKIQNLHFHLLDDP
jgi:hypothetical protein